MHASYNLACLQSLFSTGRRSRRAAQEFIPPGEAAELRARALASLGRAFEFRYSDFDHIRKDPDLDPIRNLPEFQALMKEWERKLSKPDQPDGPPGQTDPPDKKEGKPDGTKGDGEKGEK